MSYVQSLRFKLMLLCVIPLFSLAFVFIAHSVIIAGQVRDAAVLSYEAAAAAAGADTAVIAALKAAAPSIGWIGKQWAIVFVICFVCFYIPITINIKRFIIPIREAAKYSDSLAQGNINIEVVKNRSDEIGVLQQSFQNLVEANKKQAELIQRMADGDISGSYTPRSEADVVGHSLIRMLERNNSALSQVAQSAHQLVEASKEIASGSHSLAQGSTEQSAAVQQISAAISEMTRMTQDNARLTDRAAVLSTEVSTNVEQGTAQMTQLVAAIREINEANLSINKIIKVIEDIAFQTNILALNAAVEAARAGQHGKGFAVVAEEVRSLASKSADAAKDSGKLIANTSSKAEMGVRLTAQTEASLIKITQGIQESSQVMIEIAQAYKQQNSAIRQINSNIDQVAIVVHQNSATAEQSSAASTEMSEQINMLNEMVSRFKLKDANRLLGAGRY